MPIWRSVDVWPNGGFVDRPWQPDPDYDAFARSAQRVCAALSEMLPALELSLKSASHLRLSAMFHGQPKPAKGEPVVVVVHPDPYDGFWAGHVELPNGVADLSPTARGLLALDAVCAAAEQFAQRNGWDAAFIAETRQQVVDQALEFRWAGAWKASPDRKLKARLTYRIADDGLGRGRVEVSDVDGIRSTPELHCPRGYQHIAKQLRWTEATEVAAIGLGVTPVAPTERITADQLMSGAFPPPPQATIRVPDLEDVPSDPPAIDPATPRPAVRTGKLAAPPEQRIDPPNVSGLGLVPTPLWAAVHNALQPLMLPEWEAWWASADAGVLDIEVELFSWSEKHSLVVRKQRDKVIARLKVPSAYLPTAESEYVAFARDEIGALIARIAERVGAKSHPALPEPMIDPAFVAKHNTHSAEEITRNAASMAEWQQKERDSARRQS